MHDPKIEWYLTTIAGWSIRPSARADVAEALRQIGQAALMKYAQALRLLALRRYLRLQEIYQVDLHSIWPWTAEQARENLTAGPARLLMAEAGRVQATFARNNPGYALGLSPPRSLERQVELWKDSADARSAGTMLVKDVTIELAKPTYDLPAQMTTVEAFAVWLRKREVRPEPGNAAPGTSDHGQLRAIDFVVMRAGSVIAGTQRSTIAGQWTAPGWSQKLADAMAGTQFRGPLRNPYEPWHWSID
jgi:hypothetical protein